MKRYHSTKEIWVSGSASAPARQIAHSGQENEEQSHVTSHDQPCRAAQEKCGALRPQRFTLPAAHQPSAAAGRRRAEPRTHRFRCLPTRVISGLDRFESNRGDFGRDHTTRVCKLLVEKDWNSRLSTSVAHFGMFSVGGHHESLNVANSTQSLLCWPRLCFCWPSRLDSTPQSQLRSAGERFYRAHTCAPLSLADAGRGLTSGKSQGSLM